jgi:hypothetical protein
MSALHIRPDRHHAHCSLRGLVHLDAPGWDPLGLPAAPPRGRLLDHLRPKARAYSMASSIDSTTKPGDEALVEHICRSRGVTPGSGGRTDRHDCSVDPSDTATRTPSPGQP